MRPTVLVLLGLSAVSLAACAPTAASDADGAREPRQCFFASNINGFSPIEGERRDTLSVRVGVRDEYELEPLGVCQNIRWAQGIALTPALGSGNSLCVGDLADVTARGGGVTERCQVRVVRKIEPAPTPSDATDRS